MAPRQPLRINYARPYYLAMLTLGLVALVMAFVLIAGDFDPETSPNAAGMEELDPAILWFAAAAMVFCIGYYVLRALRRLHNPGPVIEVRREGIILLIGEPRRYLWNDITRVALGRHRMRTRLEISLVPERFIELRLPTLFVDDNFSGIRNMPFTIGITAQGLDRPLSDARDEVLRYRPNLVPTRQ